MGRPHGPSVRVVEEHGSAVGGKDEQGQARNIRHQRVGAVIVPLPKEALPGVLLCTDPDVRLVDLPGEDGLLQVRPETCAEAAVIFQHGLPPVPHAGAEVQAVPGGGGHAAQAGGKAVANPA